MFHGRQTNHKIKRVHERAFRIVYSEYVSSSQDLLNKDNSFTIHHQNIQSLATETYETLNNLPGDTFEGLVTLRMDSYSLLFWKGNFFLDISVPYMSSVPSDSKIKKWKRDCKCRLCEENV